MTDEKWQDLKQNIKEKFDVTEENEETIQKDDVGNEIIGHLERLTFETPLGDFKLEREVKPKILDKKVHYSHTAGAKGLVEYILSPDETTQKMTAFKLDSNTDQWEELSLNDTFRF